MSRAEKELIRRRTACRLCESRSLEEVLSLVPTPPANAFVPESLKNEPQACYPLDIFLCAACGHLQLLDVIDPSELFGNYVYVSGTSPAFVEHFRAYAQDAIGLCGLRPGDLVFEIGSNDGTLLRFFQEAGMQVLGVDPAREIARNANEGGIETLVDFFSLDLARKIRDQRGSARLIAANNVFAHADDLAGMTTAVRELLAEDGAFIFEVSYLVDVYEKLLFDTIYHEHLAYHSVRPLKEFFKRHGMELIDTIRVETHGGSLRGIAQRKGGPRKASPGVDELVALEAELRLHEPKTFQEYASRIDKLKDALTRLLRGFRKEGKTVSGFGAPAKATTLMYHFGLGPDVIDFIVDDSPLKQGLYTPGHHIPVYPTSEIYSRKPDYLLILAWNFAEPIMKNHQTFRDEGGRFIVPLPELEVA